MAMTLVGRPATGCVVIGVGIGAGADGVGESGEAGTKLFSGSLCVLIVAIDLP